jgi:hypothetical protein
VDNKKLTTDNTLNNTYYVQNLETAALSLEVDVTEDHIKSEDDNYGFSMYWAASANAADEEWKEISDFGVKRDIDEDTDAIKYSLSATVNLPEQGNLYYRIKMADKAGNTSSCTGVYSLAKYTDGEVTVKTSNEADAKDIGDLINYVGNEQKTFYIDGFVYGTPSSILVVDGANNLATADITNSSDNTSGYSTFEDVSVTLPESTNNNVKMESITIRILDADKTVLASREIGTIAYDKTEPTVTFDEDYLTPSVDASNPKWQNKTTAKVTVSSGSSTDYESYLDSASYLTNEVSQKEESLTVEENSTSTTAEITVPASNDSNGTTVKFYAADKAENSLGEDGKEYTFYVDTTDPSVSIFATSESKDSVYPVTDTESNSTTTYFKELPKLSVSAEDNIGIDKIVYTLTDGSGKAVGSADGYTVGELSHSTPIGSYWYVPEYSNTNDNEDGLEFSDLLSGLKVSETLTGGTYTVTATVYDLAGNSESASTTFVYDASAPEITSITPVKWSDDENAYVPVTDIASENGSSVLYINTVNEKDTKYAFKVVTSDAGCGTKKLTLSTSDTWCSGVESGTDGNTYYIVINNSALEEKTAKALTSITVEDNLGNEETYTDIDADGVKTSVGVIKVKAVAQEITLSANLVLDGKTVTKDDAAKLVDGTNKTYSVELTATGPNPFTELYLQYGETGSRKVAVTTGELKTTDSTYDPATKLYTYTTTLTLPITQNINFFSLEAACVDGTLATSDAPKTDSIVTILFDKTSPVITCTPSSDWVKSANLVASVTSGDGDVESYIDSAKYSIANGASVDMTIDANKQTTAAVTADDKVSIPESATSSGTSVVISAKDKAGNETESTYTYYVDATAPEISDIKIGGSAEANQKLNGNPTISFDAKDALALDEVTVKVNGNGVSVSPVNTKNLDTKKEYSTTLSKLLGLADGEYPSNGTYTITVSAKDKVGNEATAKTLSFTYDNTAPVITVTPTAKDGSREPVTITGKDKIWVNSVSLGIVAKSGNDGDVNSALSTDDTYYTISGSKTDVKKQTLTRDSADSTKASATVSSVPESTSTSGTTVVAHAKDVAGNETKDSANTYTYYVDATAPTISDINITEGATLNDDPVISFKVKDNLTIDKAEISVAYGKDTPSSITVTENAEGVDITKTITKKLSSFFNNAADGDYTVTITAYDKAGNSVTSKSVTFRLDNTAPTVTVTTTAKDGAGNKTSVTGQDKTVTWVNNASLDIKVVSGTKEGQSDQSDIYTATYSITGSKDGTGVVDLIRDSNDGTKATGKVTTVPTSNSTNGTKVVVSAKDKSGNSTTETYTYYVDPENPEINDLQVDGNSKDGASLAANPTVKFNVSDNLTLGEITVNVARGGKSVATKSLSASELTGAEEKCSYSLTELVAAANGSDYAQDGVYTITVNAKDKAGNSAVEKTISFTLDNSDPVIKVTETVNGADGNKTNPKNWVKSASVDIEVSSGKGSQSDISEATYKVVTGEDATAVSISGIPSTTVTATGVEVTPSTSIEGTKVVVTAKDASGNGPVTGTYTYFVDPTAPEIDTFTATGTGSDKTNLTGDPVITVGVSDNLTLKSVDVKVTHGKNTYETSLLSNAVEGVDISKSYTPSLSALTGTGVEDGLYDVTLTVMDKAGNEVSKTITFRVDNSAPKFTVTANAADEDGNPVSVNGSSKVWVNNAAIGINVTSGSASGQSDLTSATYEINGGVTTVAETGITIGPDDNTKAAVTNVSLPESSSVDGTKVKVAAKDAAGNTADETYTYYIDSTKPVISSLAASGSTSPRAKDPEISFNVSDNLTIGSVEVALSYNGGEAQTVKTETGDLSEDKVNSYKYTLSELAGKADGSAYAADGDYTITVTAQDKAGNKAKSQTITFRLDNTDPVVKAEIIEGTVSDKHLRSDKADVYYSSDVTVKFTVKDTNITADELNGNVASSIVLSVADAVASSFDAAGKSGALNDSLTWTEGDEADTYVATLKFTAEQWHNISISVKDKSGNLSSVSSLKFDIDKTNPKISGITLNGTKYTDKTGIVYLDKTAELVVDTTDTNNDKKDFNLSVSKKLPDGKGGYKDAVVTESVVTGTEKTSTQYTYSFTYTEEGEYEINVYTVDLAGNVSVTKTVTFVVDETAPAAPAVVLQQNRGTAENPVWTDYTSLYIDTDSTHYQYRYKITGVTDGNGPNLDEDTAANTVKVASGSTWASDSRGTVTKDADGYYVYSFNDTDKKNINALSDSETYQNYVVVKDRSGNETYVKLPELKKMNVSINFGTAELKNSAGVTKHFTDTNLSVNDTYKLSITVTTGNPVSAGNVILRKTGDNGDVTEFTINSKSAFETTDVSGDGRFITNLVFDIPGTVIGQGTDLNELYSNMTLYVTDNETHTNKITLGKLIYDNSAPYVNVLEYSTAAWVKAADATLTYEVVSGSNSVESVLNSASYTLAGTTVDITPKAASSTTGRNTVTMPETVDPTKGTSISFTAVDNSGNTLTTLNGTKPNSVTMFVDGHNPEITEFTVDGLTSFSVPLGGVPTIYTSFKDNLALDRVEATVVYPDGTSTVYTKSYGAKDGLGVDVSGSYTFNLASTNGYAADGDYQITVRAYDKAGNVSSARTLSFRVDNTNPVVDLAISGGTQGGKQPRADGTDYYYRSDVTVSFAVDEENFNASGVTVTDTLGGQTTPVSVAWSHVGDRYVAAATFSSEGAHVISIGAADMTGNAATGKSISFCLDKTAPVVSLALDGLAYNESTGVVYLTADASVTAAVADMTEDAGDLNIQIIETKPDQSAGNPSYVQTSNRSFGFSDEADYTVNFYAIDMAGNQSATRTVTFRVDKTVPELSITGTPGGGTTANATTVTFTLNEAFWWDAGGSVSIYRKAGDGKDEALYKTIDINPTAYSSSVTESLSDTGVYRLEFTANDKVGHTTETSQSFTIDRDAPVVTLQGVNNYDITNDSVSFMAQVEDDFYSSKHVTIYGSVVDSSGKSNTIDFGTYNNSGNPTIINRQFSEDGIYDIEVVSEDAAGNSQTNKIHFTIDKSDPEIGDLSAYDGTILNEFNWDIDLEDLVSDLTVCDIHMYLNGSEYDGVSDIEDGSYTLLITAEDELGHYVEKSVSFVLDTKAPVFIVTGVEDGEVKNEQYSIGVSLQLSEDTLKEVTLNGTAVDISDNTASLTVDSKGEYVLAMKAVDEAGNEASQKINFTYGEKASKWWIWLIVAGVAAAGFFFIILAKRRKKDEEQA